LKDCRIVETSVASKSHCGFDLPIRGAGTSRVYDLSKPHCGLQKHKNTMGYEGGGTDILSDTGAFLKLARSESRMRDYGPRQHFLPSFLHPKNHHVAALVAAPRDGPAKISQPGQGD
jgi:hypothetical protein